MPDTRRLPAPLAARYGQVRGPRRILGLAALAALVAVLLAYLFWVALHHSTPTVRSGLLSYDVRDAHSVEAVIQVVRPEGVAVVCELRSQNDDHVTVGTARASIPADAPGRSRVTVTVPTTERAVNAELERCVEAAPEP
jgi:hypothetical protein